VPRPTEFLEEKGDPVAQRFFVQISLTAEAVGLNSKNLRTKHKPRLRVRKPGPRTAA
jgi:hypothetical protein